MARTSTSSIQPNELTRDEIRILEECDRESVIYRSVPLSLLTIAATQYAMTRGIISYKAKWFKLGLGLFSGYILGKISYASACRKKILTQIPNSSLAQLIHGVELPQTSVGNITNPEQKQTSDNYSTTLAVNQYGDPIYKTNK